MNVCYFFQYYLRAAAPAADPGKESGIAGETGKLCDEKFWQMHHHMQDHARRAMCVTGAALGSIAVRCWLHDETVELEAYSEPNNTSMCIWAKRHKTKLPKAIMTRKLQLSWCYLRNHAGAAAECKRSAGMLAGRQSCQHVRVQCAAGGVGQRDGEGKSIQGWLVGIETGVLVGMSEKVLNGGRW